MSELWEIIKPMLDFWIIAALVITMVSVQSFKVVVKYYLGHICRPMTIKILVFSFALICGYVLTRQVLQADSETERRFAIVIAFLNILLYEGTLKFATAKKIVWLEALLRMKKVEKDPESGETYVGNETTVFYRPPKK